MSDNDTTFESSVHKSGSSSGQIYVPAAAQRSEGICIGTVVEVTMSGFDSEFITEVSFQNEQVSGDTVTVPARLMRKLELDTPTDVTASFTVVEDDEETKSLADNRGSVEDDDSGIMSEMKEEFDSMAEDLTESSEEEEENEGLGELFG